MASTYLTTSKSTPTNQFKWTFSGWFKLSDISNANGGGNQVILSDYTDASNRGNIFLESNDELVVADRVDNSNILNYTTTRKFRDPNAWYHIVVSHDRTLATPETKIYVNGVEETSFLTSTNPSQNGTSYFNKSGQDSLIGKYGGGAEYYDGLMSHVHWIDGTAYDASAFGETDATTGIWKPKLSPSVTYGTNGFFLKFNEGALGTDSSPNGNNFTVNGSLTPTKDTPENVFATLNPLLDVYVVGTYSNGNLGFTGTGSTNFGGCSIPVSKGKWYVEVKATTVSGSYPIIGVIDAQSSKRRDSSYFVGADINTNNPSGFAVFSNGDIYHNNSSSYGNLTTTYTSGDIIGMALDMDSATKTLAFYKNGTLETTINLDDPPNGSYIFCTAISASSSSAKTDWNFGNGYFGITPVASAGLNGNGAIFEFDCPSNYYALNTKNINTYG
jgi:hypothetical protein